MEPKSRVEADRGGAKFHRVGVRMRSSSAADGCLRSLSKRECLKVEEDKISARWILYVHGRMLVVRLQRREEEHCEEEPMVCCTFSDLLGREIVPVFSAKKPSKGEEAKGRRISMMKLGEEGHR